MKKVCSWTIAVALSAVCPASALGQSTARRPVQSVFGGASGSSTDREDLNATVSVDEGYDQNVVASSGDTKVPLFQASGPYTMLTPALSYSLRGNRVQMAMTASSNARYYNQVGQTYVTNHSVDVGMTASLSSETSVLVNQSVTYSPALLYGLFGGAAAPTLGAAIPSASNYALSDQRSLASVTGLGLSRKLSRHDTLYLTSTLRRTNFTGASVYPDLRGEEVGVRLVDSLSRNVGLQMGYTLRRAQYAGLPRSLEHNLIFGLTYNRPLSRTRKTSAAFTLGPTMADGALTAGSVDTRRQYRMTADASLRHEIGRTWSLDAAYHRGIGYIEGFQSPVFSAAYAATTSGFLSRRTDLLVSAAYSTGESALTGTPDAFTTYTADARLRFAMSRTWAAYVEYVFYYYEFNQSMVLPVGLPPELTRNTVRSGLTLWLPVRHR